MVFNVVIDPPAVKELKKLKKDVPQIFSRLVRSIDSLTHNAFNGKPLQGNKKGCYSLREGDYRVIYELKTQVRIVAVIRIRDRKEVYRGL